MSFKTYLLFAGYKARPQVKEERGYAPSFQGALLLAREADKEELVYYSGFSRQTKATDTYTNNIYIIYEGGDRGGDVDLSNCFM